MPQLVGRPEPGDECAKAEGGPEAGSFLVGGEDWHFKVAYVVDRGCPYDGAGDQPGEFGSGGFGEGHDGRFPLEVGVEGYGQLFGVDGREGDSAVDSCVMLKCALPEGEGLVGVGWGGTANIGGGQRYWP